MRFRKGMRSAVAWSVGLMFLQPLVAPMPALAATLAWARTYNGPANGYDTGFGTAVDPWNNVYLAGVTAAAGQGNNLLLQKYSAGGKLLWTRTYNGPAGGDDEGRGVAVAPDGSVYVTGYTYVTGQGFNLLLRKYSAAGKPLWTQVYNGTGNRDDFGVGVAVARDRNVYVAGSTGTPAPGQSTLLQKYSPAGKLLWTQTYQGSAAGSDHGNGVAVSPDNRVYLVGATDVAGQSFNVLLRKYSAAGGVLWTRTYSSLTKAADEGRGVAVASDGGVYVTGDLYVAGQGTNLLLRKYSATGKTLWTRTYHEAGDGTESGTGAAVTPEGGVYVSGYTYAAGKGHKLLLRKYSAIGAFLGMTTYTGPGKSAVGFGVAVGPDKGVCVAGETNVTSPSPNALLLKYR